MSIPKKTHEPIRQNGEIVKKSQKHDANLQKNSTIYFQVGLIVCLLVAYSLLEIKFETAIPKEVVMKIPYDNFVEVTIDKFKVFEPKAEIKPETFEKKVLLTKDPKIVDNDYKLKDVLGIDTPDQNITSDKPIDTRDVNVVKLEEEVNLPFDFVEVVPIFPGCESEKTNNDKRKCMSDKISRLIQKRFDTSLGSELGLSGKQVIHTQFRIDNTGHVVDIKVRGTHPQLEEEAKRVINIIPDMTPGRQQDKPVGVVYSLPIIFNVQN